MVLSTPQLGHYIYILYMVITVASMGELNFIFWMTGSRESGLDKCRWLQAALISCVILHYLLELWLGTDVTSAKMLTCCLVSTCMLRCYLLCLAWSYQSDLLSWTANRSVSEKVCAVISYLHCRVLLLRKNILWPVLPWHISGFEMHTWTHFTSQWLAVYSLLPLSWGKQ